MNFIIGITCLAISVTLLMVLLCCGVCHLHPEERAIEDIEQMKYLEEYNKRRERKKAKA